MKNLINASGKVGGQDRREGRLEREASHNWKQPFLSSKLIHASTDSIVFLMTASCQAGKKGIPESKQASGSWRLVVMIK